jgi:hypothetical protein
MIGRIDAATLGTMPVSLGRDLIEVLYGGWLDDPLWDTYGDLSVATYQRDGDTNTERRLYADVACIARGAMFAAGARIHSGTHFRIASAAIAELHGDLTTKCRRCDGSGKRKTKGNHHLPCRICNGEGNIRPSVKTRSEACQCRFPEFRDHLYGPYLTVLTRLNRELEAAKADYQRANARVLCASEPSRPAYAARQKPEPFEQWRTA